MEDFSFLGVPPLASKLGLTLRETRSLPSARRFAECRNTGTRQRGSLPSAALPHSAKQALGKGCLCRVPNTRQRGTLGKRRLCRVSGTRQRITLGKILQPTPVASPSSFAECWPLALGKCAVFAECCKPSTRQRGSFAECQFRHSVKYFFLFSNFFCGIYTVP